MDASSPRTVPPPLPPQTAPFKKSSKTAWIVLACVGAALLLIAGFGAAVIIPAAGTVRAKAHRAIDATKLREIAKSSMIYAIDKNDCLPAVYLSADGQPSGREPATIHAIAATLARTNALTDTSCWFSAADLERFAPGTDLKALGPVLDPSRTALSPAFARQKAFAWDFATGLKMVMPASTPIAWTRGLRSDGTWDPKSGAYGGEGGYIAFLGGNVQFFSNLQATPLVRPDGKRTSNILETLPPTVRVVGSGPGTLHGAMGLAQP
ncbi:MAG: hypothetical protein JNK23_12505 [Opitutaceae bacterium]|nr:hypothetical protein [Opitutaceae bacterium]